MDLTVADKLKSLPLRISELFSGDGDAALDTYVSSVNLGLVSKHLLVDIPLTITRGGRVVTVPGVTIECVKGGIFDLSTCDPDVEIYTLEFTGGGFSGVSTTLTASITESLRNNDDARTLTVADSSQFEVGNYITVTSNGEYFSGIGSTSGYSIRYKGFICQIREIPSATSILLEQAIPESLDAITHVVTVRKIDLLDGVTLKNVKFVGPSPEQVSAAGTIGPCFAKASFVKDLIGEGCHARNTNGVFLRSNIGVRHTLRDTRGENVFTMFRPYGIEDVTIDNPWFQGGRRFADLDCSDYGAISSTYPTEAVHTRDIKIKGGFSSHAATGVGGHLYRGLTVEGHTARNVGAGVQHRGKDLKVIGCTFDADNGIVIGVGSTSIEDPSTYSDDPSCGDVYIDSTTQIRGAFRGVWATTSWVSMEIQANIVAPQPIVLSSKRQGNLKIVPKLTGDGTQPGINFKFTTGKLDASDVQIAQGFIENATYGIKHEGCPTTPINNFVVDGVAFKNVTTYLVRGETSSQWSDDGSNIVKDCSHYGTVSGFVGTFYTPSRPIFQEVNNTWGSTTRYSLSSGVLGLKTSKNHSLIEVELGSSSTLTSITGGVVGQFITLVRSGTGSLTITDGSSLDLKDASAVLSGNDTITLVKLTNSGVWAEVTRTIR